MLSSEECDILGVRSVGGTFAYSEPFGVGSQCVQSIESTRESLAHCRPIITHVFEELRLAQTNPYITLACRQRS
jgi:hypothetical protein